jgi:PAS domain S-box-containing protein
MNHIGKTGLRIIRSLPGYLVAIGAVALATYLKYLAQPKIIPTDVPILYMLAIVPTAVFFGLGPSLTVCVLSFLAYDYYFLPPVHQLNFNVDQTPIMLIFLLVGGLFSYLASNLRRQNQVAIKEIAARKQSEAELMKYRDHLEELVQQRTSELERANSQLQEEIVGHKKDEEALRQSEERWSTTLASIGDGVIATDISGKVTFMNTVAQDLTGWKMAEVDQKPVSEVFNIVNETTRQKAENPVDKVLRLGTICSLANHTILIRKDGTEISIDDSGAPIKDAVGATSGVVLVFRDITERRKSEIMLRRVEERNRLLADILERSSQPFGIGLPDGSLGIVNKAFCDLTGYTAEELKTLDWAKVLTPPEYLSMEEEKLAELVTTGQPVRYQKEYIRKDKFRVPIELLVHLVRNAEGQAEYYYSFLTDITERKQAEEAQKLLEQNFRNSLNNSPMGVTIADLNFNTVYANQTFLDIFGYKNLEQVKASPPQDHYTPATYAEYLRRKEQRGRGETNPENIEIDVVRKDGSIRHLQIFLKSVLWDGKQQYQTLYNDITERKEATDQLAGLNEELKSFNSQLEMKVEERTKQLEEAVEVAEASNRTKSEFLASMSHELRTPLNAIIGFSQVLHEKYFGELNEKQAEYIADIVDSGKHLLSLINDILDLSKIEAGKMELDISEVKIAELLQGSLVMIKEKAMAHNISLDLKIAENINGASIRGDERRLKQVMFNLLSNSAKFTPDGGAILVEAKKTETEITVSVTDTGIGMTTQEQKRLFEAFYQASGGIKGKTPGTGLGLAITRSIIEKHGGRIWMESAGLNKGSTFIFTLPIVN